jgi:hypothetical protein
MAMGAARMITCSRRASAGSFPLILFTIAYGFSEVYCVCVCVQFRRCLVFRPLGFWCFVWVRSKFIILDNIQEAPLTSPWEPEEEKDSFSIIIGLRPLGAMRWF